MAREVFISYRRDDDAGMALALHSHLTRVLAEEQLFMDVEDGIPAGDDFVQVLEQRVSECRIMLVLIGKYWLRATNAAGERRLDNPEDFVRIEIESAIKTNKVVIPVLINDTEMPRSTELPDLMKPLARRQAVFTTTKRLRNDAAGLARILQNQLRKAAMPESVSPPSAALLEPQADTARAPTAVRDAAAANADPKPISHAAPLSDAARHWDDSFPLRIVIYALVAIPFLIATIAGVRMVVAGHDSTGGEAGIQEGLIITLTCGPIAGFFIVSIIGALRNARSKVGR
jgi:hypothetical protein